MAAVTICSDFGTQGHKICHCFHCFPICLSRSDGTRCHDLSLTGLFFKTDLIYEQDYFNTLPNSFLTQTLFAPGHSPCDKQIYFSNAQEILSHTACCNDHPHFSLHSSCLQLYLLITSRISILPRFFFFLTTESASRPLLHHFPFFGPSEETTLNLLQTCWNTIAYCDICPIPYTPECELSAVF